MKSNPRRKEQTMTKDMINEMKQIIGDTTHFIGVKIENYSDEECLKDVKKMADTYEDMGIRLNDVLYENSQLEKKLREQETMIGLLKHILNTTTTSSKYHEVDGPGGYEFYSVDLQGSIGVEASIYNELMNK